MATATKTKENKKLNKRAKAEMTLKGYGRQPSWEGVTIDDPNYDVKYAHALTWATQAFDMKTLKREALKYITDTMKIKDHGCGNLEEWRFMTAGKIAWCYHEGAPLKQDSKEYLENILNDLITKGRERNKAMKKAEREEAKRAANLPAPKTQAEKEIDRRNSAWEDLDMLYVEESIMRKPAQARMQKEPEAVYKILNDHNLKQHSVQWIIDKLTELYRELGEVKTDEQVKEAYSDVPKGEIARRQRWLKSMMDQAQNYLANTKNTRKTRKKTKSADQQVKSVRFKTYDTDYQLESIDPAKIVGAQMIMVFNTKSRKLGLYYAKDDTGLQVKGTTLQNWDVHKSGMKTLRKPQEQLPGFRKANKKRAEVLLNDNINGKLFKMNGRLNPDTVLLQVWS